PGSRSRFPDGRRCLQRGADPHLDRLQARERGGRCPAAPASGRVLPLLRLLAMVVIAPPSVDLRALTEDDWTAVADIYWDGMRDGLATFETEVPNWEVWDAAHFRGHRLVVELLGEVVGWAALSPASKRRCYAGVAENSVYVAREAQGLG